MKKAISILCSIIIFLSAALNVSFAAETQGDFKEGFKLTALNSDSTGVAIDSTFRLVSEGSVKLQDIKGSLTIEGEPAPVITETAKNNFIVKPAMTLMENRLYTFNLKTNFE